MKQRLFFYLLCCMVITAGIDAGRRRQGPRRLQLAQQPKPKIEVASNKRRICVGGDNKKKSAASACTFDPQS